MRSYVLSQETRLACASALANFGVVEAALFNGLVPALVHLAVTDHIETQVRISSAFAFLSSTSRARG